MRELSSARGGGRSRIASLVVVRHGETEWNASKRFQGRSDVALSVRGREQAHAIARALEHEPFTHAFSSDLVRARETADAILAYHPGLNVYAEERLREFDFGAWEGLTWAEILQNWPELASAEATAARLYEPPGGEAFSSVVERVGSFVRDIRELGSRAHVLAVAHAGTLHALLAALRPEGADPVQVVFATAGFSRFTMDEQGARIITLNDVSHLDPTA
jgi:alpha-ribazole phosphatase